jgi:mycothiol system anti-sigma-R factor
MLEEDRKRESDEPGCRLKDECREVLERTYLFLDGELLSVSERVEIEGHLEECRPCLERYGLEQELQALLAKVKNKHVCPERLRSKILGLLDQT